jgi:hypothetical protein
MKRVPFSCHGYVHRRMVMYIFLSLPWLCTSAYGHFLAMVMYIGVWLFSYALIGIFQMLAGGGCEHLLELKELVLSCNVLAL